ncbi:MULTISPECIES: substrate-binding domain-containing protein [unclassified Streptomyces]|uniref:substrate-binding domain-containing protein n=1 Tax=unclassified Streptomyces TaxID=2593676 RepID=UPI0009971FF5|nr:MULTISPECIES: substrate-binding domain-containing protein [unclassified Streptomyces]
MNTRMRRAAFAVAAGAMAVSLAACGSAKESKDSDSDSSSSAKKKGDNITVGLLLPENKTARYEKFDKPLIEKKIKELTNNKAKVLYNNARQDANLQSQQVDTMITNKVDVLIVDAVDSKAIKNSIQKAVDNGIKVVAYDRLAEGPISGYTSFDNEQVGKAQGEALLKGMGDKAKKSSKIVMINGSVTDPNAAQFKKGAHAALDGKVTIAKEYDTKEWSPDNANSEMEAAISAVGAKNIAGVYSANDGMAGGAITALKAADIKVPVTGQDAELAGVQRILTGDQYMSVYKSYPQEANVVAELAVAVAKGESTDSIAKTKVDSESAKGIPAAIIPVVSLTTANIKDTVIKDGYYTLDEICTAKYKAACNKAGLK